MKYFKIVRKQIIPIGIVHRKLEANSRKRLYDYVLVLRFIKTAIYKLSQSLCIGAHKTIRPGINLKWLSNTNYTSIIDHSGRFRLNDGPMFSFRTNNSKAD